MKKGNLSTGWCIIFWILPLVTAVVCLGLGRMAIAPAEEIYALCLGGHWVLNIH